MSRLGSAVHGVGPALIAWGDRSASADALLAVLIGRLAPGSDATVGRRCANCGAEDHGRPVAVRAPVVVSLSYAGRFAVAAAARTSEAAAIGIDVEEGDADTVLSGLAGLVDPPPSLRGWTRIEAALKADGRGVRVPPGEVRLAPGRATTLPGALLARVPGRDGPIEVADAAAPPGCVVSIALLAAPGSHR